MPITPLQTVLNDAFKARYGVPAFNVFDDVSLRGILAAAEEQEAPVIIQVSVKTVKYWGLTPFTELFINQARETRTPVSLHLDHCPDPELATACLHAGWSSVLFDGSSYNLEENRRITKEICRVAKETGGGVEGELIAVAGVEDGVGQDTEGELLPIPKVVEFIRETGIDCYAPAIGTAHGMYSAAPNIRYSRVEEILKEVEIPMVLHGGTGLEEEVFKKLISLGTAKVNISTALKREYADSFAAYLAEKPEEYNPLKLIDGVVSRIREFGNYYFKLFGATGKA